MHKVLEIRDDLDAAYVEVYREKFEELANSDCDIMIDLNTTRFMDSSGVGAIVFLYKRIKTKGYQLSLIKVNGQPLKLLRHLGIADLLIDSKAAA